MGVGATGLGAGWLWAMKERQLRSESTLRVIPWCSEAQFLTL